MNIVELKKFMSPALMCRISDEQQGLKLQDIKLGNIYHLKSQLSKMRVA